MFLLLLNPSVWVDQNLQPLRTRWITSYLPLLHNTNVKIVDIQVGNGSKMVSNFV